jgi:hypothetical protein
MGGATCSRCIGPITAKADRPLFRDEPAAAWVSLPARTPWAPDQDSRLSIFDAGLFVAPASQLVHISRDEPRISASADGKIRMSCLLVKREAACVSGPTS